MKKESYSFLYYIVLTERALFLKDELEHRLENQGHLLGNTGKTPEQTLDQLAAELERFLLRQNTESAG